MRILLTGIAIMVTLAVCSCRTTLLVAPTKSQMLVHLNGRDMLVIEPSSYLAMKTFRDREDNAHIILLDEGGQYNMRIMVYPHQGESTSRKAEKRVMDDAERTAKHAVEDVIETQVVLGPAFTIYYHKFTAKHGYAKFVFRGEGVSDGYCCTISRTSKSPVPDDYEEQFIKTLRTMRVMQIVDPRATQSR